LDESAAQVAVMLTDAGLGAVAGAVYKAASVPVAVIVPTVEFPFGTPLTAQLTLVSACPVLVTVATNWTIPAGKTDDMPGGFVATLTPITAGWLDELFPQPPKSMRKGEARSATTAMACAQKEERAGKDIRSPRRALVSVMVSSIHWIEECSGLIDARIRACRRRERLIDKTAPKRL
jgi:hypothetical protein